MVKILYVEDNEDNVYMLGRRLKRHGFEMAAALDGEHGLALARSERPDLILMDLSLPGVDGWEATRRLKEAPETRAIPIAAASSTPAGGISWYLYGPGTGCSTISRAPWGTGAGDISSAPVTRTLAQQPVALSQRRGRRADARHPPQKI